MWFPLVTVASLFSYSIITKEIESHPGVVVEEKKENNIWFNLSVCYKVKQGQICWETNIFTSFSNITSCLDAS